MRLWIVLNVWDGKITKFSKNKTVKCYHFVRFCNRARIRLCVLTWLCIICFICCCCTLNCCFCCLAWRCSCCLWSSSSSFLRSVSLGVFSAKILETIRTSSSFSSSSLYSLLLCGTFVPRMKGFITCSGLRSRGHGFISTCKSIVPLLVIVFAVCISHAKCSWMTPWPQLFPQQGAKKSVLRLAIRASFC